MEMCSTNMYGINRIQLAKPFQQLRKSQCTEKKNTNTHIIHSQLDAFSVLASFFTHTKSNFLVPLCVRS